MCPPLLLPQVSSLLPPSPQSVCVFLQRSLSVILHCRGLGFITDPTSVLTVTVWLFLSSNSNRSDCLLCPHTCSVSYTHVPPPFSLSPWRFGLFVVGSVFCFLVSIPKARESSSHCCPTLLQEMLCSRPARMVPSITHASSWLRWLLAEGRREPAHLPGQELQPPRGHLPGALPGCQPALGIVCAS